MKDIENHINAYSFRGVATNFGIPVLFYVYGFWNTLKIITCFLLVWAAWAAILYYIIARQKERAYIRAWEAEQEEDRHFLTKLEEEDKDWFRKKREFEADIKSRFTQAGSPGPNWSNRLRQRLRLSPPQKQTNILD